MLLNVLCNFWGKTSTVRLLSQMNQIATFVLVYKENSTDILRQHRMFCQLVCGSLVYIQSYLTLWWWICSRYRWHRGCWSLCGFSRFPRFCDSCLFVDPVNKHRHSCINAILFFEGAAIPPAGCTMQVKSIIYKVEKDCKSQFIYLARKPKQDLLFRARQAIWTQTQMLLK